VVHALVLCARGSVDDVRDSKFRDEIRMALTKLVQTRD
jgi:hypothetical protein